MPLHLHKFVACMVCQRQLSFLYHVCVLIISDWNAVQETQQSLTNPATRLEVSQGHQTILYVTYGFLLLC